jgi:hypothetical protein
MRQGGEALNRVICILALASLLVTACRSTSPAELILGLEPGLDRAEVERRLGQPSRHQVTAEVDGIEVVVTTHAVEPWLPLCFVYQNAALLKITGVPAMVDMDASKGKDISWLAPEEPETRLQHLLAMPALSHHDIERRIAFERASNAYAEKYREPSALWAAVVIPAPLGVVALPRTMHENAHDNELARRFDPFKVRLGMTTDEVDAIYGMPRVVHSSSEQEVRIYGGPVDRNIVVYPASSYVTVHFDDGRVIRVFSHEFFDWSLLN